MGWTLRRGQGGLYMNEETLHMRYWLLKSEPGTYSWDMLTAKGREVWDGVRNYQAAANLKAMQVGDQAFFYHSVNEKRILGICRVIQTAYPDPADPRFVAVDIEPVKALPSPVTLAAIKADPRLQHLALIRQSRLSVMPLDAESWDIICGLGIEEM